MLDKGLPHVVSLLSDMRKTRSSMPLFSTRLTAIVSVALVLLLLGVAAFLGIGARNVADDMRRDIGFVVIVADDASPADIAALKQRFAGAAYTSDYTYSSPEMVMQRWKTLMDDEGETDDLLDENPFAPEIEVNVRAPWANIDSLRAITTPLKLMPSVDDVKVHDTLVGEVNRTLSNIALILIIVAAVLLTISIVLINNTVRLTIYSRRFLIHTMKLVGATPGFIRAPMIRDNALGGLLAGFIADIVLTGTLAYFAGVEPSLSSAIPWTQAAWVLAALPLAGLLICGIAAFGATQRYVRITYDELYR